MRKTWYLWVTMAATLSSCVSAPKEAALSEPAPETQSRLAFVQAACGGCHAVEPPDLSPNPRAPEFEAIANRAQLDKNSLSDWLAGAHNYPEVMDFDLDPEQVEIVADYMLTLQRDDYTPPPS